MPKNWSVSFNSASQYLNLDHYHKDKKPEFHQAYIHIQGKPSSHLIHQLHYQCSGPIGKPNLGGEALQGDLNEALDSLLNIVGVMPNIL